MRRHLSSVRDELSARSDDLVALRRDLHRFPELGLQERRTSARVAEQLARAGLEVTTGIATTGVVAVLRGDRPGRTIAWRADMDALPIVESTGTSYASTTEGVMHACGHDGHTAIALTVAETLAAFRAELAGTLVFLFQPAEEVFGGAQPMIDAGVLDMHAIEEIYGLHLVSRVEVGRIEACPGVSMAAADVLEVQVFGRGGHGASPGQTIDPIAIASQLVLGVPSLLADTRDAVLSFGKIAGGSAFNIVPELATLFGSLRTLAEPERAMLRGRLAEYVDALARERQARIVVREIGCCPALVNEARATEHVHRCASGELGADHVVAGAPVMASDDMALFLARKPGCYFRVGAAPTGSAGPAHHSATFDIDERSLLVGARVAASVLTQAAGR
jgi:amidohydrolase